MKKIIFNYGLKLANFFNYSPVGGKLRHQCELMYGKEVLINLVVKDAVFQFNVELNETLSTFIRKLNDKIEAGLAENGLSKYIGVRPMGCYIDKQRNCVTFNMSRNYDYLYLHHFVDSLNYILRRNKACRHEMALRFFLSQFDSKVNGDTQEEHQARFKHRSFVLNFVKIEDNSDDFELIISHQMRFSNDAKFNFMLNIVLWMHFYKVHCAKSVSGSHYVLEFPIEFYNGIMRRLRDIEDIILDHPVVFTENDSTCKFGLPNPYRIVSVRDGVLTIQHKSDKPILSLTCKKD